MERRCSPHKIALSPRCSMRHIAIATAWVCCSLSATAVAETPSLSRHDLAWAPVNGATLPAVKTSTAGLSPVLLGGNGLISGDNRASERLNEPLQLDGVANNPLMALAAYRGSAKPPVESRELLAQTYVANGTTPASRTEPAIWAIGAIAVCGLGVAGLSAPWLAARLTPMRKGWKP